MFKILQDSDELEEGKRRKFIFSKRVKKFETWYLIPYFWGKEQNKAKKREKCLNFPSQYGALDLPVLQVLVEDGENNEI